MAQPETKWNTHHLYRLLNNPVYTGVIEYEGKRYPGEHEAIINEELFNRVREVLKENCRDRSGAARAEIPALLKGIVRCGSCGSAMAPTYTKKGSRRYSYYVCNEDSKRGESECPVPRLPAGGLEQAVSEQLTALFRAPSLIASACMKARANEVAELAELVGEKKRLEKSLKELRERLLSALNGEAAPEPVEREIAETGARLAGNAARIAELKERRVTETDVTEVLDDAGWFWEDLHPPERKRLVGLLIETVTVLPEGIDIILKGEGLAALVNELSAGGSEQEKEENES